ncbi:MAG: nucleotide exchange factor GrpE [Anaerolineales bacterium]|jgi:molecular chaperone GrpE
MAINKNEDGPSQQRPEPIASSEAEAQDQEIPQIAELQSELQEAKRQAAENLDGWKRTQAEFANFRKRLEREQADALARMTGRVMGRVFPVLDDFERALKEEVSPEALARWVAGVKLIHEKLLGVLEAEGVQPIVAPGDLFDPNRHEALSYEPRSDYQDGQVIEVMRPGYRLGEVVLRPALVRVAHAEEGKSDPSPEADEDPPEERSQ